MESSHPRGWPFTRNVFISPAPEAVAMHVVSGHSQGWSFTQGGLRLRDPQHSASLRILLETHCSGLSRRTESRRLPPVSGDTRIVVNESQLCWPGHQHVCSIRIRAGNREGRKVSGPALGLPPCRARRHSRERGCGGAGTFCRASAREGFGGGGGMTD